MDKQSSIILVTGATGRQGGAVARHLRQRGWRVRALVRNPNKPAAAELARSGVELVQGNLDDRASVERALGGATSVFSVQNFWETGAAREIQQGKTLANAAQAAGVKHFVYASVASADRGTGLPHFESKWEIEKYIGSLGLPATVLRPVFFMDNFLAPNFRSAILQGTLSMALPSHQPLQMIAVDDIGVFAALAFEQPETYLGKTLELAGDGKTMPEAAEVFSRVIGRPVRFVEQPIEEVRNYNAELAAMFEWFNRAGYSVDIAALRKIHSALMGFEAWARATDWRQQAAS